MTQTGAIIRAVSASRRHRRSTLRESWASSPRGSRKRRETKEGGVWLDRHEVIASLKNQRLRALENLKAVWKMRERMKKAVKTAVTWEVQEHENLLKELWKGFRPNTPFPGRKSKEWGCLGFQGSDPQTDFRGGGLLSLRALVYWATTHSETARGIIDSQPALVENQYPVCTAGIAISAHLSTFLGIPVITLQKTGPVALGIADSNLAKAIARSVGPDEFAAEGLFFELFSVMMRVLDSRWKSVKATYFDFNRILGELSDELSVLLDKNPYHFSHIVKQLLVKV